MNLLAIDTSTEYLSLAVTRGAKTVARMHRKSPMMHSTLLMPMIAELLKKARLKPGDLDGFCVSVGPGSFTGLRIGVTTIKGLAYSLKKPVVTVPTLDVIAENAKGFKGIICSVLDARKNKVYACLYRSDGKNLKRISDYLLVTAEELCSTPHFRAGNVCILGDGADFVLNSCKSVVRFEKKWHPRADVVARLGGESFAKKRFVTAEKLEPMYLYSRECDITGK